MRSGTEALLHGMTVWPTSCDSWHGVGCHKYLQTFLLSLWQFFQWIFVKGTCLKLFWKMWNYQKFSINQKHLLQGKHVFCITTTSFGTGWEQLSVSTTLPTVHLAQSIVYSVRGKAVPFFPLHIAECHDQVWGFPMCQYLKDKGWCCGRNARMSACLVWFPFLSFSTESFVQMLQDSLFLASDPEAMTLIQESTG